MIQGFLEDQSLPAHPMTSAKPHMKNVGIAHQILYLNPWKR